MKKKVISFMMVSVMILSAFGLAGCSNQGNGNTSNNSGSDSSTQAASEQEDTANTDEKVKIRILTRLAGSPANEVAFRERVEQFRVEYPHIEVEDLSISDEGSYDSKFKAFAAAGDVPELFATYGGGSFRSYVEGGVALDLTEAMAADKEWSDSFLPIFENFQYEGIEGTYAVPYEFFAIQLFYNKALFEQIGVEPPKTIEEFESVSDRFLEEGIIPMALGEKDKWRAGHLFACLLNKRLGAEQNYALANRTAKYNDSDMMEIYELIDEWSQKGYFGENPVSTDHTAEKAMFHNGQTAMHMNGSWYVTEALESENADNISVVSFPYFADFPEHEKIGMGGAGGAFAISTTASPEQQAAAIELLKYVTNKEAFESYAKVQNGGVFPMPIEQDPETTPPLWIEYAETVSSGEFYAEVYSYDPLNTMLDKVRDELQGMFVGQSPEDTANNIQAEIDSNE